MQKLLYDKNYSEEYAANWANIWTVWLLTRSGNPIYHAQMRTWLEEHFAKDKSHKEMVEKLLTAKGKTNDNGAVNFVLQHLGEAVPQAEQERDGKFDMVPITSRTTRLFLGLQTQCVQCHDHPFNPDWKQSNFWAINVYFRQVERVGQPNMMRGNQDATILELRDSDKVNAEGLDPLREAQRRRAVHRRAASWIATKRWTSAPDQSRRNNSPSSSSKTSNSPRRLSTASGAISSAAGSTNRPPSTISAITTKSYTRNCSTTWPTEFANETPSYEFNRYNSFDPKKLLYWICTSEPYNLSSVANPTNDKPDADVFFSRMLLKSMSPEQLFDSLHRRDRRIGARLLERTAAEARASG